MSVELLIIGLHRVGFPPPEARIRGLFISPRLLEFQLQLARRMGFRFATLQNALSKKSGKFAVVTFDDGYADVLTEGLPVLRKFKAPATIFVITGDVGKRQVVWDEAGEKLPADLLSWSELDLLRREGWEIGSHSNGHQHLSRQKPADCEESINISIENIRRNLGIDATSFAYPYGDFEPPIKKILRECGIKYAVTTKQAGTLKVAEKTDLLELPRVSVGGRKFHHYVKNLKRTIEAVGIAAVLRGLIEARHALTETTVSESNFDSV